MSLQNNIVGAAPLSRESQNSPREALWLCLHFSRLALDVFDHQKDVRPIAVIEHGYVHYANRDNLPAGLALSTAYALHPNLLAVDRQPEREREYLFQLAHWAYQFTPGVVIASGNSLSMEIGSCRLLYRSTDNLLKKINRSLNLREQHANTGLARTPKAAWLLARRNCVPALRDDRIDDNALQQQLLQTPIAVLDIDSETQAELQQMGLNKLCDLRSLPNTALGKRFGINLVDYLQKVFGETPDPQEFFLPLPRFQHGLVFIDSVSQRQMLLFPMKRLLKMLDDYLRVRQLHCHTLRWQLFDAHRLQAEFSIELSRTQNSWHTLLDLSRIKLDQVSFTTSVFSISLICEDFFESAPVSAQLFPDENTRREAAGALIDRLQARLGSAALQQIAARESHWPEAAFDVAKANILDSKNAREKINTVDAGSAPMNACRPLWLLHQPQRIPQRDNHPCWPTPLVLLRGPERIGNHWWQQEESERDYYIARNERGVICWIFCERKTQQWFLHGLFS